MLTCTTPSAGFSGSKDTLWEGRSPGTVHQRGWLHAHPQSSPHHPALWHCTELTTHAGEQLVTPSVVPPWKMVWWIWDMHDVDVWIAGQPITVMQERLTNNCSLSHCFPHYHKVCVMLYCSTFS